MSLYHVGYFVLYWESSTKIYQIKNGVITEEPIKLPGKDKEGEKLLDSLVNNDCPHCGSIFQFGSVYSKKEIVKEGSVYVEREPKYTYTTNDCTLRLTHSERHYCEYDYLVYDVRAFYVYKKSDIGRQLFQHAPRDKYTQQYFMPDSMKNAVILGGATNVRQKEQE